MKIAVLHNYMDNIGGAERVALELAQKLDADVITTNINRKEINNFGFSNVRIKSIGTIPLNWPWRQLKTLLLFRFKKIGQYDLFIMSGEWCISAAKKNKPNIWYVHSLPRHIWDFYKQKLAEQETTVDRISFRFWSQFFKFWIRRYAALPNITACNSNNTQRKLITLIKRDSILLYPPVNIDNYDFRESGRFWLSVNRISDHKRIELQLETFAALENEKLVIVGMPENTVQAKEYFQNLKRSAPKNVTFVGLVTEKRVRKLYAECKAFISTAQDEDFGLTPIEAMASGKPVVVTDEGGYKETVIDGKTGILCSPNVTSLINAVVEISRNPEKYKESCLKHAKNFSSEAFFLRFKHLTTPFKKQ